MQIGVGRYYFSLNRRQVVAIILALAFALATFGALLVRKYSLGFGNPTFPEVDPDSLLHLRRIEQVLVSGGEVHVNGPDYYSSFPYGRPYPYAPLMAIIGTNLVLILHTFFSGIALPFDIIVGFVPPLLGCILAFFFFLWVFHRSGSFGMATFCSVFLLSESQFLYFWSFHLVDHHCLEGFFLWTWLMVCDLFLEQPSKSLAFPAVGGSLLFALMLGWTGMTRLIFLLAFLSVVLLMAKVAWAHRFSEFFSGSLIVAGSLGSLLLLHSGTSGSAILSFSWFQPLFLLFLGAGMHVIMWAHASLDRRWLLFFAGIVGISFLIFYGDALQTGIQVVASEHPFFSTIREFAPSISISEIPSAQNVADKLGWLFPFLPIGACLAHIFLFRGGGKAITPIGAGLTLLGLIRLRYYRWLPFFHALWLGAFFWFAFLALSRIVRGLKHRMCFGLFLLGITFIGWFQLGGSFERNYAKGWEFNIPMINSLAWLQRNSPDPGGYANNEKPSYCVLSYWDWGNAISYYAKRPAACNNLILGLDRMASVYTAQEDTEAYQRCRENAIRYWVVNEPKPYYPNLFAILLATSFTDGCISLTTAGIDWESLQPVDWKKTFHGFLFNHLGFGSSEHNGSSHFRLVYVDRLFATAPGKPVVTIFEVVPGATLKGRGTPREQVTISLQVQLPATTNNIGRYSQTKQVDTSGTFSFTVPYPTGNRSGGVQTDDYRLEFPDRAMSSPVFLQVSEAMVRDGAIREIQ